MFLPKVDAPNNIVLSPLQLTDVEALISDTLNNTEGTDQLAELLS
ncbi:MAG: hypothetical protein V7L23_03515 [Nostoc sp.]